MNCFKLTKINNEDLYRLKGMNCFKLTKSNNEDLQRIKRNFLWIPNIGISETKRFFLVIQYEVYRPKFEIVLGIIKIDIVMRISYE